MDTRWLNEFPPHERLIFFIEGELAGDEDNSRFEELSKALGYTHSTTLKRWMDGKSKIPLRHLSGIAKHFKRDVLDLLPFWLMQEQPDDVSLYLAATRMPTSSELDLIATARSIYHPIWVLPDDDDEDDDYDDTEEDDDN